jgi:hypothetical protein
MKRVLLLTIVVLTVSFDAGSGWAQRQKSASYEYVARQFAKRLKETREFRFEDTELFVERFMDCHLDEGLKGRDNAIFRQIGATVPQGIVNEAGKDELKKYLVARLNFFHLKTLYWLSTRDLVGKWDDSLYKPEEGYPPDVYELLAKNPSSLSGSVQSVQELRSVTPTLEAAVVAMRKYFKSHPPEKTELYKKNMERIGNDKNSSKFMEVSFHELTPEQIKEGTRCLGFGPRAFTIVKVPPFYQLFIFQGEKNFRIGSVLCTEPPCVD